jgi:hypothetical protein
LEEICANFRAGNAPTTGNQEEHCVYVTLNVDADADEQVVLNDLATALRQTVGPSVLGCPNRRRTLNDSDHAQHPHQQRQRTLQGTQITNIVFAPISRNETATCTQAVADSKCIPVQFCATIFYNGVGPPESGGLLRQALFLLPAGSITDFQGWGEIELIVSTKQPPSEPGNNTTAPTDQGNAPVTDSDESKGLEPGRTPNSIAFVAAAAASLGVILAALFLIRRRRKETDENVTKIRELTDDEDDLGIETNDDSVVNGRTPSSYVVGRATVAPKMAYVLNDEFSTQDSANDPPTVYRSAHRHGPYETCNSPTCEICAVRRENGTRFIAADSFHETSRTMSSQRKRNYKTDDTVQL